METRRIEDALSLFRQLPLGAPMFNYLRGLDRGDITLDTAEMPLDTLNIGAYAIQQTYEVLPTIAGSRTELLFLVMESRASGGGYWEPEDVDLAEFTRTRSFADALREIVLREVFRHIGNIQEADGLYASITEEN